MDVSLTSFFFSAYRRTGASDIIGRLVSEVVPRRKIQKSDSDGGWLRGVLSGWPNHGYQGKLMERLDENFFFDRHVFVIFATVHSFNYKKSSKYAEF